MYHISLRKSILWFYKNTFTIAIILNKKGRKEKNIHIIDKKKTWRAINILGQINEYIILQDFKNILIVMDKGIEEGNIHKNQLKNNSYLTKKISNIS